MAGTRRLEQLVAGALSRVRLPDDPLVLALSGGADSAALGYLCCRMDRELRALHINHGLSYSAAMEQAATEIAKRLDLTLDVICVEVPEGASPEGQARQARYEAFSEVSGHLLTAHTRDDNVETVLFNLIRGTGPRGLAGIPYYRPNNIHRPVLEIHRSETRELAALASLPFVDDPMNEDPSLSRNIIRRCVIPSLTELNAGFAASVARMSASVAEDNTFLDERAAMIPLLRLDGSHAVAIGDLFAAPAPVADRVLKTMLVQTVGGRALTAERVKALWRVARGEIDSWQIEAGAVARRNGALLVLESPVDRGVGEPVPLKPGTHHVGTRDFEVVGGAGRCRVLPLSRWSAVFPAGTELMAMPDGTVTVEGELAWEPGVRRYPVAWYVPGADGYVSVSAKEGTGWTSNR